MSVKNSKYKITQVFPRKQNYFREFGGVNRNLGIYFSRTLTEKQAKDWCTTQVRPGNKLSSKANRAIGKGELSLWNLKTKYYRKYSLSYVRYLPQISALDQEGDAKADYCWLQYKRKKAVFETKEAFK